MLSSAGAQVLVSQNVIAQYSKWFITTSTLLRIPSTNSSLEHAECKQHDFLRSHVGSGIDSLGQSGDSNGESFLDLLEDLLVGVARDKGDGKTLGTESTSTTDTVEVRVGICGSVLFQVSARSQANSKTHIHS